MKLFLFTSDAELAGAASRAGVYSPLVDWERQGKHERQAGYDTEINDDTAEDVTRLTQHVEAPVTVRVNPLGSHTEAEVEKALNAGARILMLPLAARPADVAEFVEIVGERAKTLIQIERQCLVDCCEGLRDVAWDFVHIGLNDLRISRGSDWLWEPLYDGTIEHVCHTLEGRAVGFGGGTIIGGGYPIPFMHLLKEMARLDCGMCILRRSFKADMAGRDMKAELDAFHAAWTAARARSEQAVATDQRALRRLLKRVQPVEATS